MTLKINNMKQILYFLIVIVLTLTSCQKGKNNLPEPISNFIKTNLVINSSSLTDSLKGIIWINNYSNSKVDYSAYVSIILSDTVNNVEYISNILLDSENYSTAENIEIVSKISIDRLLNYNKSIDFKNLYWNDGITLKNLPRTTFRLRLFIFILEPMNPGNIIQSDIRYIENIE